jgi:hypothetical protein
MGIILMQQDPTFGKVLGLKMAEIGMH